MRILGRVVEALNEALGGFAKFRDCAYQSSHWRVVTQLFKRRHKFVRVNDPVQVADEFGYGVGKPESDNCERAGDLDRFGLADINAQLRRASEIHAHDPVVIVQARERLTRAVERARARGLA